MIKDAIDVLKSFNSITDIKEMVDLSKWGGKTYEKIIKFKMKVRLEKIGIVMAIPSDWERSLIDLYIEEYFSIDFIPHMYKYGHLCLYDLEGILINVNYKGLIYESIERLEKTLIDGIEGFNKEDFITEFNAYWNQLNNIGVIRASISLEDKLKKIKYIKNNKLNDDKFNLSAADTIEELNRLTHNGTVKNGVYINIKSKEFIYPPDWRHELTISYVNQLLKYGEIDARVINPLINNHELLLFINIIQPNGVNTPIAVIIKNYNKKLNGKNKLFQLNIGCKITPLGVLRNDSDYILNRGGAITDIKDKKVLIIGCGSIGGYLISEIVKTGISNLCIVDNDILSTDNIYRHLLGLEFVGGYKTKAIIKHLIKNIPYLNIRSYEKHIENLIEDYEIDFEEFDLIISATGNHNVNRRINRYLKNNNVSTPTIYLWNEVLGIGNHALFIDIKNSGCFECIIAKDEEGVFDRTSYCKRGQVFSKKYNGCHSTFLPFGSIHSLKTVCIGIELALKYFNGEIKENILISQKGDDTYLKHEGLLTSDRYKNQKNEVWRLRGSDFVNSKCNICSKVEKL